MRLPALLVLFFSCLGFGLSAQDNSVTGVITGVKPAFAGEYALTVNSNTLILIVDLKDKTKKSFEVNKEYKDILVEKKGKYVLNPKYANKNLVITYTINGKGWKCVQTIKPAHK